MQPYQIATVNLQPQRSSAHEALHKLGTRVWDPHTGLQGTVVFVDLLISYSLHSTPSGPARTVKVQEPLLTIDWDRTPAGEKSPSSWLWAEYQYHAREI
jgi:hypothetical protein